MSSSHVLPKKILVNNWLSQHWHSYMLHLICGELGIWFGVFGNLLQYSNLVQQRSSKRKTGRMQLAKTISVPARLWRKMWNVFVGIADYNQYLGMKIVPVFWESMSVEEDCILLARVLTRRETLTPTSTCGSLDLRHRTMLWTPAFTELCLETVSPPCWSWTTVHCT